MFSLAVIDTDRFNDMPVSARLLYYELGMRADDDGFVSSPKKIAKMSGCTEDDIKLLIAKGFVICFESGVIVITHWHINNAIRKDRKNDSIFLEEKQLLTIEKSGMYSKDLQIDNQMTTTCQPIDNQMTAQVRLGKDRLGKDNISLSTDVDEQERIDCQSVIDCFNSVCVSLPKVQKLTDKRRKAIKNADKLLGGTGFDELFMRVEQSDFLTGRSGSWSCGFDWVLKPSNLTKILEGNYNNKTAKLTAPRNYNEVF